MAYRLAKTTVPNTPTANLADIYYDTSDLRMKYVDEFGGIYALSQADWGENLLINGGFELAQRQAPGTLTTYSNTTGRTYGADRWGMTNENASIQYQRIDSNAATETNLNARMYGKFKKLTSAGKMIISQVIEGTNCAPLRGRTVRFQCKMRYSVAASMTVRLGIVYLTSAGTIDTMPATFVSAFGAVGTDPTWGTNLTAIAPTLLDGGTLVGSGMNCVLTANWVRYSATFTIPSTAKNVIAVIWTNGQPAANDELNIAEIGLYDGNETMDWTPRPIWQIIQSCQRYYCKTFAIDTAPVQNAGINTGEFKFTAGIIAAGAERSPSFRYPVTMRATPVTLTAYNPAVANAQVRDETASTDCTAQAFVGANDSSLGVTCTGSATTIVGGLLGVHISLDAEL